MNTIKATPAFKSLILDKSDVKELPKKIRNELKPGNTIFLSESEFKVTDGKKKYLISSDLMSSDRYAEKLKGTLILDAKTYRFAIKDKKVAANPKNSSEEFLKREFYNKYNVTLDFSKDEKIVNADEVLVLPVKT